MPKIITANLLLSGDVVYLDPQGAWVRDIARAAVAEDKAEIAALEEVAARAFEAREVLSVYAMDVVLVDGRPAPKSVREKIRAGLGPTVGVTAGSFRPAA